MRQIGDSARVFGLPATSRRGAGRVPGSGPAERLDRGLRRVAEGAVSS
jgi:hypothetical protein